MAADNATAVRCPGCYDPTQRLTRPALAQVLGAIVVVIMLAVYATGVYKYVARRHLAPIAQRSMILVMAANLGVVPVSLRMLKLWIPADDYSCDLWLWTRYMLAVTQTGVLFARILRIRMLTQIQVLQSRFAGGDESARVAPTGLVEGIEGATIKRRKGHLARLRRLIWWTTGNGQWALLVIGVLLHLIPFPIILARNANGDFLSGHTGCSGGNDPLDSALLVFMALGLLLVSIGYGWWGLRKRDDAFFIKTELQFTLWVFAPVGVAPLLVRGMDADIGDDYQLVNDGVEMTLKLLVQLWWPILASMGAMGQSARGSNYCCGIFRCLPSLRVCSRGPKPRPNGFGTKRVTIHRYEEEDRLHAAQSARLRVTIDIAGAQTDPKQFAVFLAHPVTSEFFERHLRHEFSVENLLAYKSITVIRAYHAKRQLTQATVATCMDSFFSRDSPTPVNVSHRQLAAVVRAYEAWIRAGCPPGSGAVLSALSSGSVAIPFGSESSPLEPGDPAPEPDVVDTPPPALDDDSDPEAGADVGGSASQTGDPSADLVAALVAVQNTLLNQMRCDAFPRFLFSPSYDKFCELHVQRSGDSVTGTSPSGGSTVAR